ncbi:ArnT family glycosyltransferase [Fibrella aquatilis]|uniref:Glycosyltransferase RgtA/B/C/D-like domain-containing protein n=1 Tax=Fibrella aquatilis TaxID=2817059 RepID=A0A939GDR5_9BACT|nr:hypothetical protein [Fibrella aquatilis]MBO0934533.1 hypothetical protein [Fibrella aquatilis]
MKPLFLLFLVLLLATAWHRSEHFDDAWFAEQAYWLVHDGQVHSAFFRGLNGWENQLFVFHKGFIYFGAAVQGLLGFSLPVSKVVGAFWTLLGGVAIALHMRRLELGGRWTYRALLIYVANGMLIEYAFVNRPEPMYMTLGFISFSLMTRRRLLVAGILAGLAVLTHLNGISYVLAGLGWLVWDGLRPASPTLTRRPDWQGLLAFGAGAGVASALYFADVAVAGAWSTFWMQFTHDPATNHVTGLVDKLLITSKLHELFFHSEEEVALSVLVLGVTLLTFVRPQKQPDKLTPKRQSRTETGRYLLLLLGSFALITKSNTDYYYLIFLPIMAVWVAQCVAGWSGRALPGVGRWHAVGLPVLLGLYLLAGAYKVFVTIQTNKEQPDVAAKNARLANFIQQPGARVIAPLDFFYNQQAHYRIHGLSYYHLLNQKTYDGHLTANQFFQLAEADSAAAVISDYGRDFSYPIPKETPARIGHYERVYRDKWNEVYLLRSKR